ncbi:active regulator of SIRT1 isoform X1 [Brachionichthys hirsutus]|uniref:active regulator of SIRT1 isoform X1 n=1 Tax=Brachionichthys hirsutus TaxID=412623 RepID=UPI003605461B
MLTVLHVVIHNGSLDRHLGLIKHHNLIQMSASLLRRGLELLGDDVKVTPRVCSAAFKVKQPPLGGTKRHGVTRQAKPLQGPRKSKATVKDKRITSAVEEYRKKQKKSNMAANLKYFMETSCKATSSDALKIMHQNSGRQSRHRPDNTPKKAKEPQSLFTEKEFQQFQKEYFGRTVEEKK